MLHSNETSCSLLWKRNENLHSTPTPRTSCRDFASFHSPTRQILRLSSSFFHFHGFLDQNLSHDPSTFANKQFNTLYRVNKRRVNRHKLIKDKRTFYWSALTNWIKKAHAQIQILQNTFAIEMTRFEKLLYRVSCKELGATKKKVILRGKMKNQKNKKCRIKSSRFGENLL